MRLAVHAAIATCNLQVVHRQIALEIHRQILLISRAGLPASSLIIARRASLPVAAFARPAAAAACKTLQEPPPLPPPPLQHRMSSGILATSVSATSKILLLTGGGVLMERRGILTADGRALFNRVVCSAMLPALLFVTTMLPLGAPLLDLAPLILSCLGTIAVGNALGRLFGRLMPTEASRKACVLACTCSNAGAVPMMLMASLCADQSSALHGSTGCDAPEGYPGLFSIPMNVLYWTWAVAYMGKDDSAAAETTTTTSQGGGAATAEAPAVAGTNLSAAPPRGMKRSRSDVFEMVDGELVAKNCGGVDDSLAEPVVLASSTLPIITSNSPRPTTALGPYQSTQPTPPPPLDLSVATIPELPVSGRVTRAPSCKDPNDTGDRAGRAVVPVALRAAIRRAGVHAAKCRDTSRTRGWVESAAESAGALERSCRTRRVGTAGSAVRHARRARCRGQPLANAAARGVAVRHRAVSTERSKQQQQHPAAAAE
jgi:hypothetical protein